MKVKANEVTNEVTITLSCDEAVDLWLDAYTRGHANSIGPVAEDKKGSISRVAKKVDKALQKIDY